ncbi:MAG: serine hydrolase [Prevotellaceae bacterium]|jgi:beta-glucosidase-like glycosyl hydrolase/CubicO group peptidase (beta-lactamase class C family)|nr:serine hydrolase [Prevotellaceae bacterium]
MKKTRLLFMLYLVVATATAQTAAMQARRSEQQWVDSVMQTLPLRQRIAQLFIAPVHLTGDKRNNVAATLELLQREAVGGVIVMKAHPQLYAEGLNALQACAAVPLLVTMDAEWGVAMRIDSIIPFPRQMTLGAIADDAMIRQMGEAVGEQCRRAGVHLNFAPVVDINNNPDNPVINSRSFGENRYNVAGKSIACMQGLQSRGVMTCIKHFPGHGDTHQDSHETLPAIAHSPSRMDSIELFPFRALMEAGTDAIMVAHLQVPAFDTAQRPSTFSHAVVSRLLRERLEFGGLVITDALNMKAATAAGAVRTLALSALLAGNDIMLMPDSIAASITAIEEAVAAGALPEHQINMKCRKMLAAKYRAGLNNYTSVNGSGLRDDLNRPANEALRYRLSEAALTLLCNDNDRLPLRRLDTLKIACLSVGKPGAAFTQYLQRYAAVDTFSMNGMNDMKGMKGMKGMNDMNGLTELRERLREYNLVIVGYHATDARAQYHFGVDSLAAAFLTGLAAEQPVALVFFGTPYGLREFAGRERFSSIIIAYDNTKYAQERSAQLLFGGVAARGALPVSIDDTWIFGNGIRQSAPVRLHYVLPEEIGLSRTDLAAVDSLLADAIRRKAMPGAQLMAIYRGDVFYHRSVGRHTYDEDARPVAEQDVYDWASITKIGATLPVVMHLADGGRLPTEATLGACLPELAQTNKNNLRIAELLTHTAGLQPFEPFHRSLFKDSRQDSTGLPDTVHFARQPSPQYPLPVADGLYGSEALRRMVYGAIDRSPLSRKAYRYSDWGFIYLQRAVERIARRGLERLADSLFYAPLGMHTTGYRPLQRGIAPSRIPPTEIDTLFRRQRVQGTVHDPTAALLGGIAGHAGVFGNADDLAKLLQLYLNGGEYGGERYLSDSTVGRFTACAMCDRGVRRGLGFDKPEPRPEKPSPVGREWSLRSYGHSGYTGNLCWVDPQRDLIVIFLSNRSFPNDNNLLNRINTRQMIFSLLVKTLDNRQ